MQACGVGCCEKGEARQAGWPLAVTAARASHTAHSACMQCGMGRIDSSRLRQPKHAWGLLRERVSVHACLRRPGAPAGAAPDSVARWWLLLSSPPEASVNWGTARSIHGSCRTSRIHARRVRRNARTVIGRYDL